MSSFHLGVADEHDFDALGTILGHAFDFDAKDAPKWFDRAGRENVRVVRDGGTVVGGLMVAPMGQFFGGRSVPMAGIAGVGIRPSSRRTGAASALMVDTVRFLRDEGFALSVLYASNQPLYRRSGYTCAGACHVVDLAPSEVKIDDRALGVRPLTEADEGAVVDLYTEVARRRHGHLDRGPYVWGRLRETRKGRRPGFVAVGPDGGLEGYVRCELGRVDDWRSRLTVVDFVAATARAGRRLWTLLADHGTTVKSLRLHSAPNDPVLLLLPDRIDEMRLYEAWMLRLLDVAAALTTRGYPPHVNVEVTFEVADDVLPENAGRWVLRVAGGRGELTPSATADVRLDVRDLAALYTGFASPAELALWGSVEGSEAALEALASIFAATPPWMPDTF